MYHHHDEPSKPPKPKALEVSLIWDFEGITGTPDMKYGATVKGFGFL